MVITDSPDFTARIVRDPSSRFTSSPPTGRHAALARELLAGPALELVHDAGAGPQRSLAPWAPVYLTGHASRSNYDRLIERLRAGWALPDRLAVLAGSGDGFQGFKGRSWAAVPGNLHLSVHLAPRRPIERFEVAFMVLAAVSVVDAIDGVPGLGGSAGIRWVNDVVLGGAKVAGVLAYTQGTGRVVSSAVLGVGVNVETRPSVAPTPFVPSVTSLREHAAGEAELLPRFVALLLERLDTHYRTLLRDGYRALLQRYRERSVVVGRDVAICAEGSDRVAAVRSRGRVRALGEGLELHLEGRAEPVTRGRLMLIEEGGDSHE